MGSATFSRGTIRQSKFRRCRTLASGTSSLTVQPYDGMPPRPPCPTYREAVKEVVLEVHYEHHDATGRGRERQRHRRYGQGVASVCDAPQPGTSHGPFRVRKGWMFEPLDCVNNVHREADGLDMSLRVVS